MKTAVQKLINALPPLSKGGMLLVGVDGCGGAGKSTLAEKLTDEQPNIQVVHIDDFYKPKAERVEITETTPVHINFEFERLKQQVLKPLKNGEIARYQTAKGETVEVNPSGYIIVEGLGTLCTELRDNFKFKVWVDTMETAGGNVVLNVIAKIGQIFGTTNICRKTHATLRNIILKK